METRTFDNWSDDGYKIIKGSKAIGFNIHGLALFNESQVIKRPKRTYNESNSTSDNSVREFNNTPQPPAGHVNFGGTWINPNDPLSDLADAYNRDETGFGWN